MSDAGANSVPPATPSESAPTEGALEALWGQVLAQWEEEQIHSSFIDAAASQNELAFAATRYRELKDSEPGRESVAAAQLAKITALALASIEASHSPPPQSKRVISFIAFVVSMGLLAACFYALTQ